MKITKKYLQKLISEEYAKIVKEQDGMQRLRMPLPGTTKALFAAAKAVEELERLAVTDPSEEHPAGMPAGGILAEPMVEVLTPELADDFKSVEELSVVEFLRSVGFLVRGMAEDADNPPSIP